MQIYVNGKKQDIIQNTTLLVLLKSFDIQENTEGVAVAVNDNLVVKSLWRDYILQDDDRVEIIWAMQGG